MATGMDEAYARLLAHLRGLNGAAVAFSGGVDSSCLVAAAREALGAGRVLALTVVAPYTARWEVAEAEALAARLGVRHLQVEVPFLEALRDNPPERCCLCKRELFGRLQSVAAAEGFGPLLDGTHQDDLQDHRPGMQALKELGVRSPFLECGLGKADIRRISRALDLPTADRPPYACLITRLPHGATVTEEALRRIERAERLLMDSGFAAVRVRVHGDLARIEVAPGEQARLLSQGATVSERLRELGFRYVALDLAGYRTGSMNAS